MISILFVSLFCKKNQARIFFTPIPWLPSPPKWFIPLISKNCVTSGNRLIFSVISLILKMKILKVHVLCFVCIIIILQEKSGLYILHTFFTLTVTTTIVCKQDQFSFNIILFIFYAFNTIHCWLWRPKILNFISI